MDGVNLGSQDLITYQIDVAHLHNVLQSIIANQQRANQNQEGLGRRLAQVETAVSTIDGRLQQLSVLVGQGDEAQTLKQHLMNVASAVDNLQDNVVPTLQQQQEEAGRTAVENSRLIQELNHAVPTLDRALGESRRIMDTHVGNFNQIGEQTRALQEELVASRAETDNRERSRQMQQTNSENMCREAIGRTERLEKELLARLQQSMDDFSRKTNENFKEVENSSKIVDGELAKLHSEIGNLHTELNTVDNDARHRSGKVAEDLDGKFNVVLNLLKDFERNNSIMEQSVAEAGRVLNRGGSASQAGTRSGSISADYSNGGVRPVPASSFGGGLGGGGQYAGTASGGNTRRF